MIQTTDRVFWRIKELSRKIKAEFLKKGIILPSKHSPGKVRLGKYFIEKQENQFYCVKSLDGEVMADNLNLPQSAVIIANTLALKNYVDKNIVDKDREYGYAYFEHQLYKRALERTKEDPTYFDIRLSKFEGSGDLAEDYKTEILYYFEKLNKIA